MHFQHFTLRKKKLVIGKELNEFVGITIFHEQKVAFWRLEH